MKTTITQEIRCSECGDSVTLSQAHASDEAEYAMNPGEVEFLCPVCFIQAKNARMRQGMLAGLAVSHS